MDHIDRCSKTGLLPSRSPLRLISLQLTDLLHRQVAPLARFEVAQPQRPDADTQDAHDGQAKLFTGLADLALPALPHDHAHPGALALRALKVDIHRLGLVAILEDHAALPGVELVIVRAARQQDAVFLFMSGDKTQLC